LLTSAGVDAELLTYTAVPIVSRLMNGGSIFRAARRKLRQKPDVILSYWVYPDGYAAVRLGKDLNVPAVLFSRGSDLKLNADYWLTKKAYRYTLSNAAAVIGVSRDLSNSAMRFGARPDRNHVIPNGVDISLFYMQDQQQARRRLSLPKDHPIALYVGRLEPRKGLSQLIQAVVIARQNCPTFRLVLVGSGMLEGELRERATQLGIEEAVTFAGPKDHSELGSWINAADIVCLPSESEGCPNVVLEALSCGRPVVATAVGGVPEIVDSQCGVLIASNEPHVIARGIVDALGREWNRERIAARWQRSWLQVARDTLDVCESSVAEHARESTSRQMLPSRWKTLPQD
jgi:glycosyltransferase involved in cell wall biosynthesis